MNKANSQKGIRAAWARFGQKHPTLAQFILFFILSNGMTVLQLILMPVLKGLFGNTALIDTPFQILPVGKNQDGSQYYIFNYAAGAVAADGTGGGLAYFLAVQVTLTIAHILNFFAQRKVTFKSDGNIAKAAFWYVVAYILITLLAGALQGLYKAPVYNLLMSWLGAGGETVADVVTMLINAAVSFWVFFPILKIIFRPKKQEA